MEAKLFKTGNEFLLQSEDGETLGITSGITVGRKLSIKNCEAIEFGYDLDELAEKHYNGHIKRGHTEEDSLQRKIDFTIGFVSALEILGDKKFNYGHLDKMFTCGKLYQDSRNNAYSFDNVLSKFEQTEWDVEIVTKPYTEVSEGFNLESKREPKLDADGCLILKKI